MNDLYDSYFRLVPDAHSLLYRMARKEPSNEEIGRDLSAWLERFLGFIRNKSGEGPSLTGDFVKTAVTLRAIAIPIFSLAKKRGIHVPVEAAIEIHRLPSEFRAKIGRRDDFEFHWDWFSPNIEPWTKDLAHLIGRKNNRILEVGSFEGYSACWLLQHLIHGPKASITCIDPFPHKEIFATFKANIAKTGKRSKVKIKRGRSQDLLRKLSGAEYDLIYLDGSHDGADVLEDGVLAWPLLKKGGTLIFDDYTLEESSRVSVREAVDFWVRCHEAEIEVLRKDFQVTIRRVAR